MRQITGAILSAALLISLLTAWAFPRMNEDLFLGLCLGREVAHGTFTDPNSWSFILPAQVFVDRAWLSHFVYYAAYSLLGALGPLSIKAILLACYAAILYYRSRALEVSREISLLAVTLGMFALAPFLTLRGENFGILCFLALTTILAAAPRWGRWRQLGAVAVVAVWSNCHGTWPIGALLIGLRVVVDLLYTFNILEFPGVDRSVNSAAWKPARVYPWFNSARNRTSFPGPDAGGWLIALVALIPVLIAANPYSLGNFTVFSYVWGTDQYERVAAWTDNLPLIHPTATLETDFYQPNSVLPFLALLGLLGSLAMSLKMTASRVEGFSLFRRKSAASDAFMEVAALFILIPIVFKWRRLIVLAAPGMVPVLALLMQVQWEVLRARFTRLNEFSRDRSFSAVCAGASLLVLGVVAGFSFKSAVIPYLPNNPTSLLRTNPPLINRVMSYNLVWADALEFLEKNEVKGRGLASLQLADYLLLHLTDIQVFMDLRAQAAYSPENFRDFYRIFATVPGSADKAIELLDRYNVAFAVIDCVKGRKVATALMETGRWGCVYMDRWVIVLARADSGRFAGAVQSATLDQLWFKDDYTRVVSQATLSLFMKGEVGHELLNHLKAAVGEYPDPEVYSLIVMAMTGRTSRLTDSVKAYLWEELDRLSKRNYMAPGGVRDILESEARNLAILYESESTAGHLEKAGWIRQRQIQVHDLMKSLCDKYSVTMRLP